MAHDCPRCGMICHCNGDIDDINFGEDPFCTHCDSDEEEDDCWMDYDDDPLDDASARDPLARAGAFEHSKDMEDE